MSDTNDKKPAARKPLTLKKTGPGVVRQSFSGGRSKSVVVEKKKKRLIGAPGKPGKPSKSPTVAPKPAPEAQVDQVAEQARKLGLSKSEFVKRQDALSSAAAEQNKRDALRKAEEDERKRRMDEEKKALETKRKAEEAEENRRLAEEEEQRKRDEAEAARRAPTPAQKILAEDKEDGDKNAIERAGGRIKKQRGGGAPKSKSSNPKSNDRRRKGKLTIVSALSGDDERQRSLASMRRAREREKNVNGARAATS